MFEQILRRTAAMVPILLLVTLIVFSLVMLIPGDAAVTLAGEGATDAQVEAIRSNLGLDEPILTQYWNWLTGMLHGDFGTSLFSSRQVSDEIMDRLPATFSLTFVAIVLAVIVSIPAGTVAAVRQGSWLDRLMTTGSAVGLSMPSFWLGLLLISVFAINRGWLPASGYVPFSESPVDWLQHLVLPAVTLAAAAAAELTRQLRSAMVGVLEEDYVRTARAKGLRSWQIIGKHALKNAGTPTITVLGMRIAALLGGTVVVERIFGIPGLGTLAVNAVFQGDLPMLQGVAVVTALFVMFANLAVDISYGFLNPRVRTQ